MLIRKILLFISITLCFPCWGDGKIQAKPQIIPATVAYEARQRKQKFTFSLPFGAISSGKLQAEVVFQHGTNPPRVYPAQTLDGRTFETNAIPLPASEQMERLRLTIQDGSGELVCQSRDFPIRVAGKAILLSAISRIELSDRRTVTLIDGQKREGAIAGLDKITVLLFGKPVTLDLSRVARVLVEDVGHLPLTVNCKVILRQNKQVVFEQSGEFQIAPPIAAPAANRLRHANLPITFQPAKLYDVPAATDIVTVGRIDEDRFPDLVVAAGQELGVLYGQGDGTFQPYTRLLSWKANVRNEVLADLNGDSRLDIVFTDGLGRLVILFNQGRRRFAEPIFKNFGGINGLRVVDVNGDTFPDLVGIVGDVGVKILLNDGKGSFREGAVISSRDVNSVEAGDVNGDGILDFIIGNNSSTVGRAGVGVVYGAADGKYRSGLFVNLGTQSMVQPCLTDFNHDGKLDVAQCDYWGHNLAILLNKGDGTFDTAIRYPASGYPLTARTADFNGDGSFDLVIAGAGSSQLSLYRNRGDGTFYDPEFVSTGGDDSRSCAVADVNGDGRPDVIVQNQATKTIAVLINITGN